MYLLLAWVVVSFCLGHMIGLLISYGLISQQCGIVCVGLVTFLGCAVGGWIGYRWAIEKNLPKGIV